MKTLEEIFAETFPKGGPVEDMRYQDTAGWDSLNHMVLCAAIEENYDIMLEITDVAGMSSFAIARQTIKRYSPDAK
jgi:acyl carrier protein